jgi:cytochrome c biogenesis protein
MSAAEETVRKSAIELSSVSRSGESAISKFIRLLCSVRLGVTLLVLLGLACFLGMVIMQQNVEGFGNYYYTLTPAQRLVYGKLDFFDIYHSWYFNALLCVLSLNIVLASIDRFPKTWTYISMPNLSVPLRWLREQSGSKTLTVRGEGDAVANRIESAMRRAGWKKTFRAEKNGRLFIFGQSGVWNRLGAYAVHVGLLTIFFGGFLTAQLGTTGQLPLSPGEKTNLISDTVVDLDKVDQVTKRLPFEVAFTDIQQKLIKKEGSLSPGNTIDWITRFTITDEDGTHEAMVQMNRPFDFRGYRFFQSSFTSIGRARNITVRLSPADAGAPQEVTIPRNGTATLADGTKIKFAEFRGTFRIGKEDPNEDTTNFPNPAAVIQVIRPDSTPQTAYAFGPQMANIPIAKKPVAGFTYQLLDFEKVSDQHILSVQRDPGSNVVYVGFILLFLTLVSVFFFSHQRVWAAIEETSENTYHVTLGGNTNRNQNAFAEKFRRFVNEIGKSKTEAEA